MNRISTLVCASVVGGLAVATGAFGAHALKAFLAAAGRTDTFELAVRYQFYHALALLGTGILMAQFPSRLLSFSALFFLFGILFFSGSLYVLCFTGLTVLGAVTPFGGVLFIAGWAFLAIGVYRNRKAS